MAASEAPSLSAASPDLPRLTAEDYRELKRIARNLSNDGYANLITGLGRGDRDHRTANTIAPHAALSEQEIEDLYRPDYIARKVVDVPAADAVRRGVSILVQDDAMDAAAAGTAIADALEDLQVAGALREALRLDRKDGGAAALIAADDGSGSLAGFKEPLDPRRVQKLSTILPLERSSLRPTGPVVIDPTSRLFGLPSTWMVRLQDTVVQSATTLQEVEVHASRLLVWRGLPVSRLARGTTGRRDTWGGDSVLEQVADPLSRYRTFLAYLEATFKRFSVLIFKMAGLAQLMTENTGDAAVLRRVRLISMAMSTLNAVPIDKDTEEVTELASTLAGVADSMLVAQDDVAGATGMPLTKLFGHSPRGFSTDDEPGLRNYQELVGDVQTIKALPAYNELIRILCLMPKGPTQGRLPRRWQVVFRALSAPTEDQVEDRLAKRAQSLATLITSEVISPVEGRNSLKADPHSTLVLEEDDGPAGLAPELDPDPAADPNAEPGVPGVNAPSM